MLFKFESTLAFTNPSILNHHRFPEPPDGEGGEGETTPPPPPIDKPGSDLPTIPG